MMLHEPLDLLDLDLPLPLWYPIHHQLLLEPSNYPDLDLLSISRLFLLSLRLLLSFLQPISFLSFLLFFKFLELFFGLGVRRYIETEIFDELKVFTSFGFEVYCQVYEVKQKISEY